MYWHQYCFVVLLSSLAAYSHGNCQTLSASSNTEYPPYVWYKPNDSNQLSGALPIFLSRLGKELGIHIEAKHVGPWARTQQELKNGKLDAFVAFYTSARSQYADYLYPEILRTKSNIWVNQAQSFTVSTPADLQGKVGITVINNSFGQEFDNYAKAHLKILEVSSIAQAIQMLSQRRVDYLLYEALPAEAYINKLQITNLQPLPYELSSEPLYLALSKKSPCNTVELKQRLESALQRAAKAGWAELSVAEAQQAWLAPN